MSFVHSITYNNCIYEITPQVSSLKSMDIQVTYKAKWQLKSNTKYKWTTCKKLINCQTGRQIAKTLKGTKPGYYVDRIFVPLSEMSKHVEMIPKNEYLPF